MRVNDWLSADEAARGGNESIAIAIARLNSLALGGNQEALGALVRLGNYVATSLFIFWARGNNTQRELLRKVAGNESSFPVVHHQETVRNKGYAEMVKNLSVGASGQRRANVNQRTKSDVIDAAIDAFIHVAECLKKSQVNSLPHGEYLDVPELVAENSSELAKRIVQAYERTDPGFRNLVTEPKAFHTLGRSFQKRKDRKKKTLRGKRERSYANEAVSRNWTDAHERHSRKVDAQYWQEIEKTTLAAMEQSPGDVRTDFREAIASRLKSRLKASPKNSS